MKLERHKFSNFAVQNKVKTITDPTPMPNFSRLRQIIKPWMLPIAMAAGILFHDFIDNLQFLAPWLIFVMLFITFCRVKPGEIKITSLTGGLIAVQIIGSAAAYFLLRPINETVAQGIFICVFCPTATAAPVITGMLGGSIPRVATYSIICNLCVAVSAPIIFTLINSEAEIGFTSTLLTISSKVMPLIIAPLILAPLLLKIAPKVHAEVSQRQALSFYIWAISLFIVVGRAVSFVMQEPAEAIPVMTGLALLSCLVCCLQFWIGRKIGGRCGDKISGAQGLGQKNTVLAIWMCLTYLHPLSSVAPASYIVWQNIINSAQLYYKSKKDQKVRS